MELSSVKIIKDSIYNGNRLTTFELEYPRYIHPEVMTHRVFSRNAQSSRAIPVKKSIELIESDEWYPYFMKNKPGMSAEETLNTFDIANAKGLWKKAKREAINNARYLMNLGVHKQVVNRLIEPFSKIKVILTATEFDNFFKLRCHPAAQQEIQEIALKMKSAMYESLPNKLDIGEWHLPYITFEDEVWPIAAQKALSTARCARVSYLNHNGTRDPNKDIDLHNQLLAEKHMSPFEHVATPSAINEFRGNFKGWMQYRKEVE